MKYTLYDRTRPRVWPKLVLGGFGLVVAWAVASVCFYLVFVMIGV